jgi:hypothetical protein
MNQQLREGLLAMDAEDSRIRAELAAEGSLFDGYHPRMQEIHVRDAGRSKEIIAAHGWPGRTVAGDDGAEAAWRMLQHSIGDPEFLRASVPLLEAAIAAGEAPGWQLAFPVDRIRTLEGRPQLYGSQFEFDSTGVLNPSPIEDPERVNERRKAVGLNTIEERTREIHEQAVRDGEHPPKDRDAYDRRFHAWLREAGWRK